MISLFINFFSLSKGAKVQCTLNMPLVIDAADCTEVITVAEYHCIQHQCSKTCHRWSTMFVCSDGGGTLAVTVMEELVMAGV